MKITVDKTTSTYTRMMRNLTDGGAWTDCPSTSDFNTGRWITGWQTTIYPREDMAAGIVFINHFGSNQNYEYLFDDFAIKGISTIPSTGVTLTQDYEGNSTAFTKTQNSEGTVVIETANGNSYAKVTPKADGNLRVTATGVTSADGWVGKLPNTAGTNSVLQFDIYATADSKAPVVVEFCSASGSYSIFSLPTLPKKETWYTYKVTQGTPRGVNSSASVVRSERGTGVWTVLVNGTDFAWKSNANSGIKAEVVIGSSSNTYGMPADAFYLDNITLSTMESYSYIAAREGNNLTVDFAHDKVKELIQTTQRAVMLATFADGVLVDVDYQAVANDGGTVAAELEASALGANKAELYVWEVETGRPVMTNVLDLTSYIQ